MTITQSKSNSDTVLKIAGRLDANTAPQLEAKINEAWAAAPQLVLDMADVSYISSAGLRVVLTAQKSAGKGRKLTVQNPSDFCLQVFEATGIDGLLSIRL